ncbi:MAG: hypothetical protein ACP5D2_01875 [Candidatus Nanoarchaeia archaeon]
MGEDEIISYSERSCNDDYCYEAFESEWDSPVQEKQSKGLSTGGEIAGLVRSARESESGLTI